MNDALIFTVTSEEFNTLLDGIIELPFKRSADLYFRLRSQAQEQTKQVTTETKEEGK